METTIALTDLTAEELKAEIVRVEREIEAKQRSAFLRNESRKIDAELEAIGRLKRPLTEI
jgi:hypothetical protein